MQTLLYSTYGVLQVAERPLPTIGHDEVLVRVSACGLCGSELETFRSRSPRRVPPLVMGHEFCGVVEDAGADVHGFHEGSRVVVNAIVPCGSCVRCARGDGHLCAKREVFGMHRPGAFAEFVAAPARCLVEWPDALPAESACLAEPLGNGVHVVTLTRDVSADTVVVLGAGAIGLAVIQSFVALRGSRVVAIDMIPERLRVATSLGAAEALRGDQELLAETIYGLTSNEGADIVVDAVGSAASKRASIAFARPGGAIVWIGLHENEVSIDTYEVTLAERHIYGTYGATLDDLTQAVGLMESGKVDMLSWITVDSLGRGVEVFERMLHPSGSDIKAVLIPE